MRSASPHARGTSLDDSTSRLLRDFRFVKSIRYAFPLAWGVNRRLCAVTAAATLFSALVTPVLVCALAAVVNELQTVTKAEVLNAGGLYVWFILAGALVFLMGVAANVKRATERQLSDEISLRVNHEFLSHAASLSLETLEHQHTQDAVRRAGNKQGSVVLNVVMGVLNCVAAAVQTAGFVGVLIWIEPFWSGLLTLLCVPYLVAQWYLSRSSFQLVRSRTKALRWSAYYSRCLTSFSQIPVIRVLRLAPLLLQRYDDTVNETLDVSRKLYRLQAVVRSIALLLTLGAIVGVLAVVGHKAVAGRVGLGQFVAFWTAAWRLQSALTKLAESASSVFNAHFDIVNLREFMNLGTADNVDRGIRAPITGRIECRHLCYRYPESPVNAVDDVSVVIEPGETVAFVGPNGAGKTTLARLITGLYQPSAGEVLVDGVAITDWDLDTLYRGMGLMPQELFRFEASAHENIAIGNVEELLEDRQRVCDIARRTEVDPFLRELPNSYDTHLGRVFGESNLSGGQWRRISLARALAGDPRIILLDEPFSGLDPTAERRLNEAFRELLAERTAIVISHRFSFVHVADRIIVMQEGRIAEEGSHDDLMRLGGLYATLYQASIERFDIRGEASRRKSA